MKRMAQFPGRIINAGIAYRRVCIIFSQEETRHAYTLPWSLVSLPRSMSHRRAEDLPRVKIHSKCIYDPLTPLSEPYYLPLYRTLRLQPFLRGILLLPKGNPRDVSHLLVRYFEPRSSSEVSKGLLHSRVAIVTREMESGPFWPEPSRLAFTSASRKSVRTCSESPWAWAGVIAIRDWNAKHLIEPKSHARVLETRLPQDSRISEGCVARQHWTREMQRYDLCKVGSDARDIALFTLNEVNQSPEVQPREVLSDSFRFLAFRTPGRGSLGNSIIYLVRNNGSAADIVGAGNASAPRGHSDCARYLHKFLKYIQSSFIALRTALILSDRIPTSFLSHRAFDYPQSKLNYRINWLNYGW